jgi:hypothetical protein
VSEERKVTFLGRLFGPRQSETVRGTRVLISASDESFAPDLKADSICYKNHYRDVRTQRFESFSGMCDSLRDVDVVHFFSNVKSNGDMLFERDRCSAMRLLDACVLADVKLLIVANANAPEAYVNNFNARGKRLNLIMTLDRKNAIFADWLNGLLAGLAGGVDLPTVWVKIAPQTAGPWHDTIPSCIFYAGRPKTLLLD